VAQPNAVPDPTPTPYNVHQEPTDSALAWQRSSIVIADNVQIKYTFSANEVAFQKLTLALRYAQSAVADPDNYADKMKMPSSWRPNRWPACAGWRATTR